MTSGTIYSPQKGIHVTLTTDSPMSSYGIPVLRVTLKGESFDLGPADILPNGLAAGDLARMALDGRLEPGVEGRLYPLDHDDEILCQRFLDLWTKIDEGGSHAIQS